MTPAPARPALAALNAGIAHVARHHRALPASAPATLDRRLALRVALNVARELDTLLGHGVAEAAGIAGVALSTPADEPATVALAELRRWSGAGSAPCAELARAGRLRAALTRAVASRRGLSRHRLDAIYPAGLAATYRRIAGELARVGGDDGVEAPG